MSQVFGDPKRLVNDYMAASHAIGINLQLLSRPRLSPFTLTPFVVPAPLSRP